MSLIETTHISYSQTEEQFKKKKNVTKSYKSNIKCQWMMVQNILFCNTNENQDILDIKLR